MPAAPITAGDPPASIRLRRQRSPPTSARIAPPQTILGRAKTVVPRSPDGSRRRGRSGVTPRRRWICAPIRKISRRIYQAMAGRGICRIRRWRLQHRVCRTRRDLRLRPRRTASRVSRPWPATATAFGRVWRRNPCRRSHLTPWALRSSPARSPRREVEAIEHVFPKEHPLRPLFLGQAAGDSRRSPPSICCCAMACDRAWNMREPATSKRPRRFQSRSCRRIFRLSTWAGTDIRSCAASSTRLETEFVCIPRPLERSASEDGGPLRYRVRCRTELWKAGELPRIEVSLLEGDARFSMD